VKTRETTSASQSTKIWHTKHLGFAAEDTAVRNPVAGLSRGAAGQMQAPSHSLREPCTVGWRSVFQGKWVGPDGRFSLHESDKQDRIDGMET